MTNENEIQNEILDTIYHAAACYIVRRRQYDGNPLLVVTREDIVSEFPELEAPEIDFITHDDGKIFADLATEQRYISWSSEQNGNVNRDDTYMMRTDIDEPQWKAQPIRK